MQVAILGTGKMGGSIAKRLHAAGHELTLWNRTRSRAEALGLGRVVATPAEAVRGAEVVISILTDATAVRGAYLGGNGAASAARDQVFIEMSTAGPDVVREVKPAVERSGAKFIGCPVMGSTTAMEAGKGILFAAGDDAAITRARPVLEALGEVDGVPCDERLAGAAVARDDFPGVDADPYLEGNPVARLQLAVQVAKPVAHVVDLPWDEPDPLHLQRAVAHEGRVMLAGRLGPDNVRAAIRAVQPWAVDAASRLESRPGVKDHEKVQAFVEEARK